MPNHSGIELPDLVLYGVAAAVAIETVALVAFVMRLRRHEASHAQAATPAPRGTGDPPARKLASLGDMEDLFLLHRSGLLLKHYTRRLRPNMDSDVLSGMLVAVQEFIKDSFRGEGGSLDEIRFGDLRIKVLEGKWTILAGLVRGEATEGHKEEMRAALKDLETRYEDLLIDWDGTMDRIPEVDRIMQRLIDGGYREPVPAFAAS